MQLNWGPSVPRRRQLVPSRARWATHVADILPPPHQSAELNATRFLRAALSCGQVHAPAVDRRPFAICHAYGRWPSPAVVDAVLIDSAVSCSNDFPSRDLSAGWIVAFKSGQWQWSNYPGDGGAYIGGWLTASSPLGIDLVGWTLGRGGWR